MTVGSCPSHQLTSTGPTRLAHWRSGCSTTRGALTVMRLLDGSLHALDQVVHLLELDVLLPPRDAGGQDLLAVIAGERALEDDERARLQPRLGLVGLLLRLLGDGCAVGGELHEALFQPAAHQVV